MEFKDSFTTKKPIGSQYSNKRYKIVRCATDDEGTNEYVLIDIKNKKVLSHSITGTTERNRFSKLSKNTYEGVSTKLEQRLRLKLKGLVEEVLKEEWNDGAKTIEEMQKTLSNIALKLKKIEADTLATSESGDYLINSLNEDYSVLKGLMKKLDIEMDSKRRSVSIELRGKRG